jgi:predicted ATP-grasp superfamily ATP-dependent carboligase
MNSRGPSQAEAFGLAVVGLSARALARAARRAGLRALALDLFADSDTRYPGAMAGRFLAPPRAIDFVPEALLAALRDEVPAGLPLVLGAGFEGAPELMRAIARRNPIQGASPEAVAQLKDPFVFADLLKRLGAPHAEVAREASGDPAEWLSKRAGASGGAHIRDGLDGGPGRYFQQRAEGVALSALFVADGRSARMIGMSEQWTDPAPGAPYRYGGAVGPVVVPHALLTDLSSILDAIVAATGLAGLASLDLLAQSSRFVILEVNPRPGATLDLFDHGPVRLLELHLAACAGRLPPRVAPPATIRAAAVVYADSPIAPAGRARPVWTADWPSCEETISAGDPLCTVLAAASSPAAARALVLRRKATLLASLRSGRPPAPHSNPMVSA